MRPGNPGGAGGTTPFSTKINRLAARGTDPGSKIPPGLRNHGLATKGSGNRIMELPLHARERGDNINDAQYCITREPSECCG